MINWISIKDRTPDYCEVVLIAYSDKDGTNRGIIKASLQSDDRWLPEFLCEKGEDFDDEYSIVTHWFPYQEYLNYPDETI